MTPPRVLAASRFSGAPCERLRNNCLGFFFDAAEIFLAKEVLGVNLVNLFRTRRARGKPAILCDHLDSANRVAVSRSCRENLLDLLTSNFGNGDVGWGQSHEGRFLFRRGGGIDPVVKSISQVPPEVTGNFARISSETRRDFRRQETPEDSILVGGPPTTLTAKKP